MFKPIDIASPIYDIEKSYLENAEQGPFFPEALPERVRPPKEEWKDFLGFKIASPMGIPAGPLLNAKWIRFAARMGYDVLCYKTIRSHSYPGHPLPNIVYVEGETQILPNHPPPFILKRNAPPDLIEEVAITNSFGMPSRSPEFLRNDIAESISCLEEGQILIVSVVGTPPSPGDYQGFLQDFVQTARFAKEAGAKMIEANFSCPNVSAKEGCLYMQPKQVYEIASKIVQAIGDVPLIIKVGLFPHVHMMLHTFAAAARAGVHAISGINTIGMQVLDAQRNPALGPNRPASGICGNPIRESALDFVQKARLIIDKEKFDFALMACGGIMLPEHFSLFLDAGADVAMTATGMMWDPYLALRAQSLLKAEST